LEKKPASLLSSGKKRGVQIGKKIIEKKCEERGLIGFFLTLGAGQEVPFTGGFPG